MQSLTELGQQPWIQGFGNACTIGVFLMRMVDSSAGKTPFANP